MNFIPIPTEDFINEDNWYIYFEDKIYSKKQYKYLSIRNNKKKTNPYSSLIKDCYDSNNPHMTLKKTIVYYHYDI